MAIFNSYVSLPEGTPQKKPLVDKHIFPVNTPVFFFAFLCFSFGYSNPKKIEKDALSLE